MNQRHKSYKLKIHYNEYTFFKGRECIINDDYAELIIEYNGDYTVFNRFPNADYDIISFQYAVVHIPKNLLTFDQVKNWDYSLLPKVFGLLSSASMEVTGISTLRGIPNFDLRGQGVLIGFVDTGINYLNSVFQYNDNTTRIVSIWDQTITTDDNSGNLIYGKEYTRDEINQAITSENPLEIVPSIDENGHGTMIAGIAAGKESPDNDFYGVATEAELVVVKLKQAKQIERDFYLIPEEAVCYSEVDILYGINYLLEVSNALKKPLIICFALGTSQGGHDGRGPLSNTLSSIGVSSGIGVVVAAGTEGNGRRHYYGVADKMEGVDIVELNVGEADRGFTIEFWGESPNIYSVDLISPSGERAPSVPARVNESYHFSFLYEQTEIDILYELVESQVGSQVILLRFVNPLPGRWRLYVYEKGDLNRGFHMWLPMDKFISDETFFIISDPYTTILDPANATVPITATAYNSVNESLYLYASRGYTRTGRVKPNIAAPGTNVVGPYTQNVFREYSGSGVATAITAGVAAMIMEWGYYRKNIQYINTIDIKLLMQRGARRDPNLIYPNREWGYGILDVFEVFNVLR